MQMFGGVMEVVIEAGKRLGHVTEMKGSMGRGGGYFN